MTCCPSADKVRSSGLSSLPVAQRFLNGPAPLSPQVAVVPKASRATAPRTRSALVLPCPGGFSFLPSESRRCETHHCRRVSLSGLVLCLWRQPRRFARRLGRLTLAFFRPFRLPLVTPLREHHQLLLNSGYLRRGSLPFLSQGIEFT